MLTKVGEGDLDEEDDGYYSSSDEEEVVTEDMAARGVGEAGCVTVSDKIWNSLVPRDLLGVYRRQLRGDSAGIEKSHGGKSGPVDAMLESLRTETKGLRRTKRPETAKMFLTWKNALKCRAILDARRVNASDPRKPPKFRLPGLEASATGWGVRALGVWGGVGAVFFWQSWTCRMLTGASASPPPGAVFLWWGGGRVGVSGMRGCHSDGPTAQ